MGIVNLIKGIGNAFAHRRATNTAQSVIGGVEKISEKLPKYNGEKLVDPLKKAGAEVADKFAAYKGAVATGVGVTEAREALSESRKAATGILKEAKSHIGDIKSFARGNFIGKILSSKFFLVPAAIVAATVVLAKLVSGKNKRSRAELVENRNQAIAAQQAEVDAIKANTMMGLAPAPGDHAARVLAARSGAAMGIDTSNPNMTAANFEAVRA